MIRTGRLIREIWCIAEDWARCHPADPMTAMEYTLAADRLVLEFQDAAGWLAAVPGILEVSAGLLGADFLDECVIDEPNHRVKFVKRF